MEKKIFNYRIQYYFDNRIGWFIGMMPSIFLFSPFTMDFRDSPPHFIFQILVEATLIFFSFFALTGYYGIEFNLRDKTYNDYLWILGLRKGKIRSFDGLRHIEIRKGIANPYKYTNAYGPISRKIREYDAYVILSTGRAVYLRSELDMKRLVGSVR